MSDQTHAAHADHPNYIQIYVILLVLFATSVAGPMVGIPWLTLITAFGIAIVKAYLVCANFMHLKTEQRMISMILLGMLMLLGLMVAGVAPDVMSHSGHRWEKTVKVEIPPPPHHAGDSGEHGEHGEHADGGHAH